MKAMTMMDNETWNIFVHSLVAGSIRGMKHVSEELEEMSPGVFPPVDDAHMLDVAVLLAATLMEANPEYTDAKRFGKGADMVRNMIQGRLREVRRQSDALGTKMLYKHIEAALGSQTDAGLIN